MTAPAVPPVDEVARWELDLNHCPWLVVERELPAPETDEADL